MSQASSDDNDGMTPLHLAAARNEMSDVLKLLKRRNADINVRTKFDETPLHEAAKSNYGCNNFKVMKLLMERGADVNALDISGLTPLFFLVKNANVHTIELFLSFKADVKALDDEGKNLLYFASSWNAYPGVIQFLVDSGLDVNHRDDEGKTPLHWACEVGPGILKNLKTLLYNGANVHAVDDFGNTPLTRAATRIRGVDDHWFKDKIKALNFIMDQTDFGLDGVNVLAVDYTTKQDFVWQIILKHLAKLQKLGILVHPDLLGVISRKRKYKNYYQKCEEELLRAESTRLPSSGITFYDVLVDCRRKLKDYAGREDLVESVDNSESLKLFPIYRVAIKKNVRIAVKTRKLYDQVALMLSYSLPIFDPLHSVVRDVLDCVLSKKDLSLLAK